MAASLNSGNLYNRFQHDVGNKVGKCLLDVAEDQDHCLEEGVV